MSAYHEEYHNTEPYRGYQIDEAQDKYGSKGFTIYSPNGVDLGAFETIDEAQKAIDKNIESIRDQKARKLIRFCELPIENQVEEYLKALNAILDVSIPIGSSMLLFQIGLDINGSEDWNLELQHQREKDSKEGTKP